LHLTDRQRSVSRARQWMNGQLLSRVPGAGLPLVGFIMENYRDELAGSSV
jgi:hypothetical protein